MIRFPRLLFLCLLLSSHQYAEELPFQDSSCFPPVALTNPGLGRLGDQLLNYAGAKWLSYRSQIPVVMRYFDYSEGLRLSELELTHRGEYEEWPLPLTPFEGDEQLAEARQEGEKRLLLMRPFAESLVEHYEAFPTHPHPAIDWEDKGFRILLQEHIAPNYAIDLLALPKERIAIALHLRMGTGVDPEYAPRVLPLKFPPIDWYLEQLATLLKLAPKEKWYLYLFTDDPQPQRFLAYFKRLQRDYDLKIDYRQANNRHDQNVLEDFFSMAQFDCIIRPMSNFSLMAAKVGDPSIEIYPSDYVRRKGNKPPQITKTTLLKRKPLPRKHNRR